MSNNQHLVEVLCAIRFDPNKNDWDSTYFGLFYELVKNRGYIERKEQRQVGFQLNVKPSDNQPIIKETPSQSRMVFSNLQLKSAIIMGENFISFHKLSPYENWEKLVVDIVQPGLEEYRQIGLGNGIIEVQCLYLNKYRLEAGESVTKYFNFFPNIPESKETQVSFQGRYEIDPNTFVQLRLNTTLNQQSFKDVFFECSGFVSVSQEAEDFKVLAQKAHDSANNIYKNIIKV